MDLTQAILLAIIQGITELFPVSSLGHAVVLPHLLGWNIDQAAPSFLPFLVTLHVGTAVALLVYFWRDWWLLLQSLLSRSPDPATQQARRLLLLLVLGTIPAGVLGLVLEKRLAQLFAAWQFAAIFLILNGAVLAFTEWLRRGNRRRQELTTLKPWQAVAIGASQALALLPGLSRSGCSMAGGLLVGLSHQSAARFSFLLATPIIFAAAVLEVPKLTGELRGELGPALIGGVVSGLLAYASTAVLMRYFKRQEVNALLPFSAYCVLLGAATLLLGR